MTPTPAEVVDAINAVSGEHAGHRAAHAKGSLMAATFTATPAAASLSRAPHLDGAPRRATVRFSNGGGDPNVPDYAREARGVAIKVYVDDETRTDMVGLTLPCFFVRTVEDFHEFTKARAEGMEAAGAFVQRHPEAIPAIQAALGSGPPSSYATVAYNGIHTFRWTNADGEARHVRWRLEPEQGAEELTDEDAKARGRDYLQEEIAGRAGTAFRLLVAIAQDGDPIDDPTARWPDDRETVEVGRLVLDGPETERERSPGDVLVFDPTRCIDGVEPSADPILQFRPRAYAVSVHRRTGAPIPPHLT
ncbi:MAG TPA: catalase family peroxidase [Solirubrobacteraceae bacterium]|nr:catalase family peroxidase [Solirubrobacteraceae bacterium]